MIDMQSEVDHREIDIDQVGVTDLRYPITVLDKARERQSTVASIAMCLQYFHSILRRYHA